MYYSNLIDKTADIIAAKIGCEKSTAAEMVENVVFNSGCDLHAFFKCFLQLENIASLA